MENIEIAPFANAPRPGFRASSLALLLLIVVATAVAAVFVDGVIPVALAAVAAALIPQGRGWGLRAPMAIIAGLLTLFVVRLWPDAASLHATGHEGGHTLSFLLWIPIAGAVALVAVPREAHRFQQAMTLAVMFVTLAVSLPLLGVSMGRTYHFAEDIAWIPRYGIRYHLAIDGISLWLVMLTVFIVPIATYASFGSITTRMKDWCIALLLLEGAMIGALVSLDLFLFYVFWS